MYSSERTTQKYIKNYTMKLLLWETEFYALSVLTGELESFRGTYIEAYDLQSAIKAVRKRGMDYLQLTGTFFDDVDDILRDESFYEGLEKEPELGMSFDDFTDWLDQASGREALTEALEKYKELAGMGDYVKIIEAYLKLYDNKNKDNKDDKEAS